jgi:hypothetical protein
MLIGIEIESSSIFIFKRICIGKRRNTMSREILWSWDNGKLAKK